MGPRAEGRSPGRRRIASAGALLALATLAALAWATLHDETSVATDNAYVKGNVVVLTPQVPGTVVSVRTDETSRVEKDEILVTLDDTDARNLLRQKAMQLARVVRETKTMYLNAGTLRSALTVRTAHVDRARAEVARTAERLERREALYARGMITREDIEGARASHRTALSELAAAEAAVGEAREALGAQLALVDGVQIEQHPAIGAAAAEMRDAWLAARRTEIRAPLSGHVARRNVQVGQHAQAGANLMLIVALDQLWVEGNFKESQLRHIRIGQAARLSADAYGQSVTYSGRVAGLGAGTGAAFALLPAQNATGNWTKIVQRVPVRIALDRQQLDQHPLRIGLSMRVEIDIRDRSGPRLGERAPEDASARTPIFDALGSGADEAVRRIIAENLRPGTARAAGPHPARQPSGPR